MSEEVALVEQVEVASLAAAGRGRSCCRGSSSTRGRRRWGGFSSSSRRGSRTGGRGRPTGGRWGSSWLGAKRGGLALEAVSPLHVAAYIGTHPGSVPTVKQHLAAIRMLGDWLVVSQVLAVNPAAAVRGPNMW